MNRIYEKCVALFATVTIVATLVLPTTLARSTIILPFPGKGTGGGCGAPSTVFTFSQSTNGGAVTGFSVRQPAAVTGGGNQLRATFAASTVAALATDHVSVGIQSSTSAVTTTPTYTFPGIAEILFSGASGFSIASSATIVSDWTTFTFTSSNVLIVIMDISASVSAGRQTNGGGLYFKAAAATYNQAAPAGFSTDTSTFAITTIEARTC